MSRSQALAEYLRRQAALPFGYGTADCVTLVADWVQACRGVDPLAPWRGYASRDEAVAHIQQYGGCFWRSVSRALRQVGIRMTTAPEPGDVAIVTVGGITACAIRGQRRWAMRMADGGFAFFSMGDVRVIAAWRI